MVTRGDNHIRQARELGAAGRAQISETYPAKQSRRLRAITRQSDWSFEEKAELHIEGQFVLLEKGDSWVVPKGPRHTYKLLSKPLLQLKRPANLRRCMAGTNSHGGATSTPAQIYKATL